MQKLQFLNPVGIKSDNFSTVRLGSKWAERTKPESQDEQVSVELTGPKGESMGTALVRGCWVGPLAQVPALLVECNHDPVMRTWSGVAQVIAGIYAEVDDKIGYDTIITVLQLEYTGSVIQTPKPGLILPTS